MMNAEEMIGDPLQWGLWNRKSLVESEKEKEKEKERKKMKFVIVRVGSRYKVYKQTDYPNGWSRSLLATFKTSLHAKSFVSAQ